MESKVIRVPCIQLELKRYAVFEDAYQFAKLGHDIGDGSGFVIEMKLVEKERKEENEKMIQPSLFE
jgi:hypothetical protein